MRSQSFCQLLVLLKYFSFSQNLTSNKLKNPLQIYFQSSYDLLLLYTGLIFLSYTHWTTALILTHTSWIRTLKQFSPYIPSETQKGERGKHNPQCFVSYYDPPPTAHSPSLPLISFHNNAIALSCHE